MLRFLSHIRDNDNTTEDCKDLSNRLLSFCSISRHSPRELENDEKKLRKIIDQYLVQKGRLIHVSLRDVHKAAKKLRLDQNLIWGWSIIITVCFEKTVDEAYRNRDQIFGGRSWLLTRTPGRALYFNQKEHQTFDLEKRFRKRFVTILHDTLTRYCEKINSEKIANKEEEENKKIIEELEKNKKQLDLFCATLILVKQTHTKKQIKYLRTNPSKMYEGAVDSHVWGKPVKTPPIWARALAYPAARGVRRFRSIQEMWQDLLSSNTPVDEQKIRPHSSLTPATFVYLDCIQLSELIWNSSESWIQCFKNARIIAPIIEISLVSFIGGFDTLYPKYGGAIMRQGPKALGGDELHIVVPKTQKAVENQIAKLGATIMEEIESFGLVQTTIWERSSDRDSKKLSLKAKQANHPLCPKQMWWAGIIDVSNYPSLEEMNEEIGQYSQEIKGRKDTGRDEWDDSHESMFILLP